MVVFHIEKDIAFLERGTKKAAYKLLHLPRSHRFSPLHYCQVSTALRILTICRVFVRSAYELHRYEVFRTPFFFLYRTRPSERKSPRIYIYTGHLGGEESVGWINYFISLGA